MSPSEHDIAAWTSFLKKATEDGFCVSLKWAKNSVAYSIFPPNGDTPFGRGVEIPCQDWLGALEVLRDSAEKTIRMIQKEEAMR